MAVSPMSAAAAGILVVGFVLHVVGVATPAWGVLEVTDSVETEHIEFGLWKTCSDGVCREYPDGEFDHDFLRASRAMAILGLIASLCAILASGAVIYYIHTGRESQLRFMRVAVLVLAVFAGLFMIIAAIVMIEKLKDEGTSSTKPGYSSGLTIAAACLTVLGGGVSFFGARQSHS